MSSVMDQRPQTWHHGLMARWWAEFNTAEPAELGYYRRAIERFGEPALDLGCGAGRLLVPLLEAGLDVDGADISADMLACASELAATHGLRPALHAQAFHELDLPRRYRTILSCDSFGIGGSRAQDRLALRRVFEHLEPGGAFVFSHELPYGGGHASRWERWLPGRRGSLPGDWPAQGERRRTADGDELELLVRLADLDPLLQRSTYEVRVRRWRDGSLVEEEEHRLHESLYFAQELLVLLAEAGFDPVEIEAAYAETPATPDDGAVVFVVRRPG
jgi:SAM-dependent methyltransferase